MAPVRCSCSCCILRPCCWLLLLMLRLFRDVWNQGAREVVCGCTIQRATVCIQTEITTVVPRVTTLLLEDLEGRQAILCSAGSMACLRVRGRCTRPSVEEAQIRGDHGSVLDLALAHSSSIIECIFFDAAANTHSHAGIQFLHLLHQRPCQDITPGCQLQSNYS